MGYFALKSPIMHHFFGGTFLPSQSEPPLFWTDKVQSGDQRASAACEVILSHPMVESRELTSFRINARDKSWQNTGVQQILL